MRNAIILLVFCTTLAGCSIFQESPASDKPALQPLRVSAGQADRPAAPQANDGWWQASALTPRSALAQGLIAADSGAASDGKPVIPPDLNNGKSFFSPDRTFSYLYANYPAPKQPWWRDFYNMPVGLWHDTKTLAQPRYLIILGIGAALAGGMQPLDHRINNHLYHEDLLKGSTKYGNTIGNPGLHFGIAGALYLYSLAANDDVNRARSTILLEGLVYDNAATLLLKAVFERETPNGKGFFGIKDSFPSGHVSSTFAMASMLDEMYGHAVGYPLYVVGGFVGLCRLQHHDHYLSDDVFGAFLGYAIGHAVFERHRVEMFGFKLEPIVDPDTDAVGLALTRRF